MLSYALGLTPGHRAPDASYRRQPLQWVCERVAYRPGALLSVHSLGQGYLALLQIYSWPSFIRSKAVILESGLGKVVRHAAGFRIE